MREIEIAVVRVPEHKKDSRDAVREKFTRLIDIAGALSFVNAGNSVLIKVSAHSDKPYPATTDPQVVSMLIDHLVQKGPSAIFVGDRSVLFRKSKKPPTAPGIASAVAEAAKKYTGIPIRLITFDDYVYRNRYLPKEIEKGWEIEPGKYFFRVPKMLFEEDPYLRQQKLPAKIDHIIVLAGVKTHRLAGLSMGMESYVGFMDGPSRRFLKRLPRKGFMGIKGIGPSDKTGLQERIAEMLTLVPLPRLVILDGREPIITGGPNSNNRIRSLPSFRDNPYTGVMLAGGDIVAVDAAGVALLKTRKGVSKVIRKHSIWELPTFRRMGELGLCASQVDKICLDADSEDELFNQMAWYLQ
jgi:uncharacterized protein (DUF362 family)